jgi:hypothetical protein
VGRKLIASKIMHEAARNLRTAERYLLAPPLAARFGAVPVGICDISLQGARFRHENALDMASKSLLHFAIEGSTTLSLEAVIVWTRPDSTMPGKFLSGVRTYGSPEIVQSLIAQLQATHRTNRIEELRSTDRFYLTPTLEGDYGGQRVQIDDLSTRGARIELAVEPLPASSATLRFAVPESLIDVAVMGEVKWTAVKTVGATRSFSAGLLINEKPEVLRLAIGHLCEMNRASFDAHSLRLKLKIIRARARQMAPSYVDIEASGIPAEQYLLIQGVREELRLNPEEAMFWYRRARLVINDPATRAAAPLIANHPDALAVWEYLDRSVDPSIVGRAFELEV